MSLRFIRTAFVLILGFHLLSVPVFADDIIPIEGEFKGEATYDNPGGVDFYLQLPGYYSSCTLSFDVDVECYKDDREANPLFEPYNNNTIAYANLGMFDDGSIGDFTRFYLSTYGYLFFHDKIDYVTGPVQANFIGQMVVNSSDPDRLMHVIYLRFGTSIAPFYDSEWNLLTPQGRVKYSFTNGSFRGTHWPPTPVEVQAVDASVIDSNTIVFSAKTNKINESCEINFSIRSLDGNTSFDLGPQPTAPSSTATYDEADFTWDSCDPDTGNPVAPGTYYFIAQVGNSPPQETTFVVEGSPIKITAVTCVPPVLSQDDSGTSEGMYVQIKTSASTNVTLSIRDSSSKTFNLTSLSTQQGNSENVAEYSWSGILNNSPIPPGDYTLIVDANGDKVEKPFSVVQSAVNVIPQQDQNNSQLAQSDQTNEPIVAPNTPITFVLPSTNLPVTNTPTGGVIDDPVSITSGNFSDAEMDLILKSRLSIRLARVYHSLSGVTSSFGNGWHSPFTAKLEFLASDVLFINGDGSRVLFHNVDGSFKSADGVILRLTYDQNTKHWLVSNPRGGVWSFDQAGKLTTIAKTVSDINSGDAIQLSYDSLNRLQRASNPAGQWFEFSFNPENLITSVLDSAGRKYSYSYDGKKNLVSVANALGEQTQYSYNDQGFLTQIERPGALKTSIAYENRRATKVIQSDGSIQTFSWSTDTSRLTMIAPNSTTHVYKFTPSKQLTSYEIIGNNLSPSIKTYLASGTLISGIIDALGQTSNYLYYSDGLLQKTTDPLGNSTAFEYHPTLKCLTKKTDALGREWRYSWDEHGNIIAKTDPASGATTFTYDGHNNCTSRTDPLGRITRFDFDELGNFLVRIVDQAGGISSISYDLCGNIKTSCDQLGRITSFEYDSLGRLTKTVLPDGSWLVLKYDPAGNLITRRDHLGREIRYTYDSAHRPLTTIRPDNTVVSTAYDVAGNKVSETDALGKITRFENNGIGRVIKIIYPDSAVETLDYDAAGRLIAKHDALGNITSFEFDPLGRLLATIDPTGARWESQYDAVGRKIADKDPLNRVTSYQFDNLDRVTKVIRPDNSFTTNSFDAVGNLLSMVDALGNSFSWVYDSLNRQVRAIQPNGASSTTTFDAAGQVIAETDALGRTSRYSFDNGGRKTATTDALGNVWQSVYDSSGCLIASKDPLGAVSSMTYDIMDRVISQSDPLGNVNSFEFDNAGRRVAKTDAMGRRTITAYDQRDRVLSEVDPEGHVVSYGYNLAGQRVSLTDGANRTWRWEFDSLGRVIREIDPLGNTTNTGYDKIGNRIALTNARNQTTNYTIDSMNRVSKVTYPDGTLATMAYDLEGRELVRSGTSGSVVKTYDSVGNMTSETFGPWGKKWLYSFDLAGNRISATDPEGQIFKYSFDKLNRMVSLNPPEKGDEIKYSFDAAGRLITEERPGVKTTNTFDLAGRLLQLKHER
ncbi:MAG: hypothetical protein HQM09_24210, partial [Candidatus Riflebacteria bacterium]|nr:hypothetical protein [Candidatus Riflebacteria bacterium]